MALVLGVRASEAVVRERLVGLARGREGSVQRGRERGLAGDEGRPGELDPLALAFLHELEALGSDGERELLAVQVELAFECAAELGGHGCFACIFSSADALGPRSPSAAVWGNPSATCAGRAEDAGTAAVALRFMPL